MHDVIEPKKNSLGLKKEVLKPWYFKDCFHSLREMKYSPGKEIINVAANVMDGICTDRPTFKDSSVGRATSGSSELVTPRSPKTTTTGEDSAHLGAGPVTAGQFLRRCVTLLTIRNDQRML